MVYAYGVGNDFCAVEGFGGSLRFLPETWTGVAQWFGVTAFLFCVHSMVSFIVLSVCTVAMLLGYKQVIPLESVMKQPKNMPAVLDTAALVVVGINLPFALYGYLLFGQQTQGMCMHEH